MDYVDIIMAILRNLPEAEERKLLAVMCSLLENQEELSAFPREEAGGVQ